MNDKIPVDPAWKPESENSLRKLIKSLAEAGAMDHEDELPSAVRARLEGQISGKTDVDTYVKKMIAEMKAKGEI